MADAHAGRTASTIWRRPSFLVSAVLVVLLLVIGAVVMISNLMDRGRSATTPPEASQAGQPTSGQSASPTAPGTSSICGLPGYETTGSVTRAPAASWSLVGTTAAPSSGSAGPAIVDRDGFRRCFSHTAEGALFASANFTAMGSGAGLDRKIAQYSIAKGSGRDRLLSASPESPTGGVRIQIVGFRVLAYSGGTATVDIAMRTSRGALAGQVYDLVWEDGDWKARVTDQGELLTQIVQLPDSQGYIAWAGA